MFVIGNTPFGFGSSSPRFPKERKDSTPGPGNYDPKLVDKKTKGGSFSKASRFDEQKVSRETSLSHSSTHVKPKPMSELDIVQQVKQEQGMQKALEMAVSFPRKLGPNRQVAAVVIDSKGTVSKACFGQHAQSTTEHTRFRIGSLSKFVTGVAVKKLEGTGFVTKSGDHSQLSGNTKLSEVFSQDELRAMFGSHHQRGGRLRLQQLMDQRSGIRSQRESDPNTDRRVGDLTIDELNEPTTSEFLRVCNAGLSLGFKFPETSGDCPFNYTNFNATLVGAVLERVCGKPFQEIMQETLFNPLGLTETGYSTPLEEQRASSFKSRGSEVWKQEEYSDSHFFDASSHIWTSAHDLTLLFQHLNPAFTKYFQTLMETDQGQNYHSFAKTRLEEGVFSFGHDGGRDDFGSAVHMDSEGRVMIWLENANVAEVDGSSQLATGLLEMTPFHGDPTRINTSQVSKVTQQLASEKRFNGSVTVFKSGQLVEQSIHESEEMGAVDQATLFRIGSSTKMFTSIAIMKLVEDGRLNLDTPIKDIFVDRDCPGKFGDITVRALLTHSSGLSGAFDDKSDLSQDEIFSNIITSFQEDLQDGPCYSNSGFYLLGMVIEKFSGQPYSEFMHDTFFKPVGMSSSFCDTRTRDELMQAREEEGDNALHYHINYGDHIGKDDVHVSAKNISSAGNIISTPYDMAMFMQSMLDQLANRPSEFPVSRETLLTMMGDSGVHPGGDIGLNRGLGLVRLDVNGHTVVGHPGIQEGFGCEFFVDPNSNDGFVVMNNLGFGHVDDLGRPVQKGGQPVGAYLGKQVF